MLPQEIIRAKRDGAVLSASDISAFIAALVEGHVTEGQAAAFAMAVFFRGMNLDECVALTRAMTDSGARLSWDLPGPVLDKHSTGGVGDNVSLILAPLIAACGGFVPMISGRGLGHTGGTLDKLESVPGYNTRPDRSDFQAVVRSVGCAVIGQTDDLAPADRRLYAIRDITATVESIPLITASILSKKLAAGLDGLVMDVKTGNGAFMPTIESASDLAQTLASVATGAGLPTVSLLTDMNQPLANAAGNAVEVRSAIDVLCGRERDTRLVDTTLELAAEMLVLGGLAQTLEVGRARADSALSSGHAAERFSEMVSRLGGPSDLLQAPDRHLPRAPVILPVFASEPGWVSAIDTRAVGVAVISLGGGRRRASDTIDHATGFSDLAAIGDAIGPDDLIGLVHARTQEHAERGARALRQAFSISPQSPAKTPLFHRRFEANTARPS